MTRRRQGRLSLRDTMLKNIAADKFYASASERDVDLAGIFAEAELPAAPKKRTPRPAGDPSEHQIQVAVIQHWALIHSQYHLPEFALAAFPMGGARDMITGARMKAEGARRGLPDLMLFVPRAQYHGLLLELKTRTGSVSNEQKEWIEYLRSNRYLCLIFRDAEATIHAIKEYLNLS